MVEEALTEILKDVSMKVTLSSLSGSSVHFEEPIIASCICMANGLMVFYAVYKYLHNVFTIFKILIFHCCWLTLADFQ